MNGHVCPDGPQSYVRPTRPRARMAVLVGEEGLWQTRPATNVSGSTKPYCKG
jgi:hypothetical protein